MVLLWGVASMGAAWAGLAVRDADAAPDAGGAAPRMIDVAPAVAAAVRGLGADVAFYTNRRRPLASLAALRDPGRQVASPHLQLGRGVLALLRAGGAPIDPGATALMTLLGERQLSSVFAAASPVELLLVREGMGGGVAAIEKAGGQRVIFRDTATGKMLAAPAPNSSLPATGAPAASAASATAATPRAAAGLQTSFGPLVKVERTDKARQRHFEPTEVKVEARTPRAGHLFVKLHITRDFSRGLGTVSFLYGSGIIVESSYDRLKIEADGKRLGPAAVFDEGPTLELAYEVPSGAKRVSLIDGDARLPLPI
jgi:hypothetical protein